MMIQYPGHRMPGEHTRVHGTLKKIFHRGHNHWMAGEVLTDHGPERFCGTVDDDCAEGFGVSFDATWAEDRKYGWQWKIGTDECMYPAPQGKLGLVGFCRQNEYLRWLSQSAVDAWWDEEGRAAVMAALTDKDKLVKSLKLDVSDAVALGNFIKSRGPALVLKDTLPHLPEQHVKRISAAAVASEGNAMSARDKIVETLKVLVDWNKGGEAVSDPFGILVDAWRCPLSVADEVFMEDLGGTDFARCRMDRVYRTAMRNMLMSISGANYIPIDEDRARWNDFRVRFFNNVKLYTAKPLPRTTPEGFDLDTDDGFTAFTEKCADGSGSVVLDEARYGPMEVRRLYTKGMFLAEKICAEVLADAAVTKVRMAPPAGMQSWGALDDSQKAAVRAVLKSRMSFVTGGPGTGKTRTLGAIVEAWTMFYGGDHDREGRPRVMVLAPTGKAMNRAKSSTGCGCCGTIDRLFVKNSSLMKPFWDGSVAGCEGLDIEAVTSEQFHVGPGSLVIVDESSMIDVEKAGKLLFLLRGCTIVFAGDVDQLPPIEPGAFFRECLDSNRATVAKLTENHRSRTNKALPAVANSVRSGAVLDKGDFTNFNPDMALRDDRMDMALMTAQDGPAYDGYLTPAENVVVFEFRRLMARGVDPRDIMVLSPFRGESGGRSVPDRLSTYNLNGLLQDVVNPVYAGGSYAARGSTDAEGTYLEGRGRPTGVFDAQKREIRIGDRLMNLSNSPDLEWRQFEGHDFLRGLPVPYACNENKGVFNGEGGVVRRVYMERDGKAKDAKPCRLLIELDDQRSSAERAAFPEKPKWLVLNVDRERVRNGVKTYYLDNWVLGYCITVHKSQGCEAPYVIAALSATGMSRVAWMRDSTFLSRNLLYTAITRAGESCLLVGPLEFVNMCAATPCPCRFVALKDRIRRAVDALKVPVAADGKGDGRNVV